MFQLLFILFITVPIVEIYLLFQVGGWIGFWPTLGAIVLTAVIGAMMFRAQGLRALTRVQRSMAAGQVPAQEMLEGIPLIFGGALLLTPGFMTDAVGFLCLVPGVRRWLVLRMLQRGVVHVQRHGPQPRSEEGQGKTIEGDYRRED